MKKLGLGSDVFGTSNIKTEECLLFAKAAKELGSSNDLILADMHLIDDLLSIMSLRSTIRVMTFTPTGRLRKDATLSQLFSKRLDLELESNK
jgi:hypothetical protein